MRLNSGHVRNGARATGSRGSCTCWHTITGSGRARQHATGPRASPGWTLLRVKIDTYVWIRHSVPFANITFCVCMCACDVFMNFIPRQPSLSVFKSCHRDCPMTTLADVDNTNVLRRGTHGARKKLTRQELTTTLPQANPDTRTVLAASQVQGDGVLGWHRTGAPPPREPPP